MITKTAKEIIKNAKYFGGVRNSDISDFYISTVMLNNTYRDLYNKVSIANNCWIKEYEVCTNDRIIPLPNDCLHVLGVYYKSTYGILHPIDRSPVKAPVSGAYIIENNSIKLIGPTANYPILIKYSILPETITAPDDAVRLDIDLTDKEIGLYKAEEFLYFKDTENYFKYDLETKEIETITEEEFKPASTDNRFIDGTLTYEDNKVIYKVGEEEIDVSDCFIVPDKTIIEFHISDPYVMVTYSDNTIKIYTGFDNTDWNLKQIKSKRTYGKVVALDTDDSTGKGCIYIDEDNNVYECSFVPDTIINYPNNAFFTLIEYKIAGMLAGITGYSNEYLTSNLIPEAEQTFYNTLSTDNNQSYRINNVIRGV